MWQRRMLPLPRKSQPGMRHRRKLPLLRKSQPGTLHQCQPLSSLQSLPLNLLLRLQLFLPLIKALTCHQVQEPIKHSLNGARQLA